MEDADYAKDPNAPKDNYDLEAEANAEIRKAKENQYKEGLKVLLNDIEHFKIQRKNCEENIERKTKQLEDYKQTNINDIMVWGGIGGACKTEKYNGPELGCCDKPYR